MSPDGDAETRPTVSVVLPTYGRDESFFCAALHSVFDQTYQDLEIVVVDDAPVPIDVGADPPVPVRQIREDHNGVAEARNTGIEAATGEFVAFLDDDDRWQPQKVERQLAAFHEGGEDIGVVVTGQRYIDDNDDTVGLVRPSVRGDATVDLLHGRVNCATSSLMVRATAAAETGGLDERLDIWEDWEWCIRLSESWKFRSIPDPLVLRRVGEYEQLTDNFEEMRDHAYPLFLRKHRPLAARYGPAVERGLVASLSVTLGNAGLGNGYYADARRSLLRSIRYNPRSTQPYLYLLLALGGRYTYEPAKYLKRLLTTQIAGRS